MNRVKKKKVIFHLKKIHFRIDKHKKDFILLKLINQPLKTWASSPEPFAHHWFCRCLLYFEQNLLQVEKSRVRLWTLQGRDLVIFVPLGCAKRGTPWSAESRRRVIVHTTQLWKSVQEISIRHHPMALCSCELKNFFDCFSNTFLFFPFLPASACPSRLKDARSPREIFLLNTFPFAKCIAIFLILSFIFYDVWLL